MCININIRNSSPYSTFTLNVAFSMYFSLYIFAISLTIGILPLISQYRNEIQLLKSQLLSKGGGGDGSNIDIAELERQKQSHAEEKESLILEKSLAENELGEEEERERRGRE